MYTIQETKFQFFNFIYMVKHYLNEDSNDY